MEYLEAFIPIFGLALNVLVQVATFRLFPNIGLLRSEFLGYFFGLFGVLFFDFFTFFIKSVSFKELVFIQIIHMIVYFCFGHFYFNVINLTETARRIRILRELYEASDGLTIEELLERYNAKEIIDNRINRLMHNRQILLKDGKYYIGNPFMFLLSKGIVLFKLILLGKKSEFE